MENPFLLWKFGICCLSLFCSLLLYAIYQLALPGIKMNFYRKQGISCYYFPLVGRMKRSRKTFQEYGDTSYHAKQRARTQPEKANCSNIGNQVSISLLDVSLIRDFYLNNDNYEKAPFLFAIYAPLLGRGLLTAEGKQWKMQRKILSNSFHFEFLKSILPDVQRYVHQNLLGLQKFSLEKVNMMQELQRITGEVIGMVFFGEKLNEKSFEGKPLTLALADIVLNVAQVSVSAERFILGSTLVKKGILPKHRRLMQKINAFRKVCGEIIEERKLSYSKPDQTKRTKDMLDLLLKNSDGQLSESEIVDQFVTFFLAGMDSTAHLINIAIYFLHKFPEYKEKMTQEVKEHYNLRGNVTIEQLNKMEFTMAFIKETLRYMTPVTGIFPRKAVKDHKVGDLNIRKGDIVSVAFFYNHYNPVFFKDPDTFDPIRWLSKPNLSEGYAFTPFSAGPRNCIGQHLALIEARIILAEFLMIYEFEMPKDYKLRMAMKFLYDPYDDILLNLTPKIQI